MTVKLVWATPEADSIMGYCARVSNPDNQENPSVSGLLSYCMREGHVSVFEMASVCLEINTTRDIGRQIIRHRSFSFQEFSQRYASVDALPEVELRECRLQDMKNRQNSIATDDEQITSAWEVRQNMVKRVVQVQYDWAIKNGIAKEQARVLLPEGLTASRLYMNGTMRSWLHYLKQRLDPSTQKEHRVIAQQALDVLRTVAPITMSAFFPEES